MIERTKRLANAGVKTLSTAAGPGSNFESHHLAKEKFIAKGKNLAKFPKELAKSRVSVKSKISMEKAPVKTSIKSLRGRAMKFRKTNSPSFNPYQKQLLSVKNLISNIETSANLKEVDPRNLDSAFISAVSAVKSLASDGAKGKKTLLKRAFKEAVIRLFIKHQKLLGPSRVRQVAANIEKSFNVTLTKKES